MNHSNERPQFYARIGGVLYLFVIIAAMFGEGFENKWGQTPLFSPLQAYQEKYAGRNEAMAKAYRSGTYTMTDIASFIDVHYMTVSRTVRTFERKL